MTSHPPPASEAISHPPASWKRGRWIASVAIVALLAGGMVVVWWRVRRAVPVDPPMPAHISDPEILHAVQKARQVVVDKPGSAAAWGQLGMTLEAHFYEPEAECRCFAEASRSGSRRRAVALLSRACMSVKLRLPEKAIPFQPARRLACPAVREYRSAVNLRLAETLLEQQQFEEAERLFRQELFPLPGQENLRAAYGLGLIAVAQGNVQDC